MRITREFAAPPDTVFRAHTDPELLVQWLGPRSTTMRIEHCDRRTGGSYRFVRTFTDLGNGRTRLIGTSLIDSFEARDGVLASGMQTGVREGHGRLDELPGT